MLLIVYVKLSCLKKARRGFNSVVLHFHWIYFCQKLTFVIWKFDNIVRLITTKEWLQSIDNTEAKKLKNAQKSISNDNKNFKTFVVVKRHKVSDWQNCFLYFNTFFDLKGIKWNVTFNWELILSKQKQWILSRLLHHYTYIWCWVELV